MNINFDNDDFLRVIRGLVYKTGKKAGVGKAAQLFNIPDWMVRLLMEEYSDSDFSDVVQQEQAGDDSVSTIDIEAEIRKTKRRVLIRHRKGAASREIAKDLNIPESKVNRWIQSYEAYQTRKTAETAASTLPQKRSSTNPLSAENRDKKLKLSQALSSGKTEAPEDENEDLFDDILKDCEIGFNPLSQYKSKTKVPLIMINVSLDAKARLILQKKKTAKKIRVQASLDKARLRAEEDARCQRLALEASRMQTMEDEYLRLLAARKKRRDQSKEQRKLRFVANRTHDLDADAIRRRYAIPQSPERVVVEAKYDDAKTLVSNTSNISLPTLNHSCSSPGSNATSGGLDKKIEPRYVLVAGKNGFQKKIHIIGEREVASPSVSSPSVNLNRSQAIVTAATRSSSFTTVKPKSNSPSPQYTSLSPFKDVEAFNFRDNVYAGTPTANISDIKRYRREAYWKERVHRDFAPRVSERKRMERVINIEKTRSSCVKSVSRVALRSFAQL